MARDSQPMTPEQLLKEMDDAERALVWMDRLRWPISLIPLLATAGLTLYYRLAIPTAVRDAAGGHALRWEWSIGFGLLASAVCFAGFTGITRHFRRVLKKAREDLYAHVPSLRPPA